MKRVKAGSVYVFRACALDAHIMPEHHTCRDGQYVRVVNLPGAPPANTMGQCHVEDATSGDFLGMVSVASLHPQPRSNPIIGCTTGDPHPVRTLRAWERIARSPRSDRGYRNKD